MFRSLLLAGAAAAVLAPALRAEPAAPRPDPLDAHAAVPPPAYRSPPALRRHGAEPEPGPDSWRAANERVARIGGWRAYAREAAAPAASAPVRAGEAR